MGKIRDIARYYGRLLLLAPSAAWRVMGVVGRLVGLAALVLFLFLGYRGDIPLEIVALLLGLGVLGALLLGEYDRFEILRKDRDKWRQKDVGRIEESHRQFRHEWAWEELGKAIDAGRDIWTPLRLDRGGVESDWVSKVDRWETTTREMVRKHWSQYEPFYVSDTGLPASVADWRARLETIMDIKLNRLIEIMTRDIRSRNPGIVFDAEKPVSR
jgi:hypothetical protein